MPYVSELLDAPVGSDAGRLGRVRDVIASAGPAQTAPVVTAVVIDGGRRLSWQSLVWERRSLRLVGEGDAPARADGELNMRQGLLDKQILDARGMKVVRVNDVKLVWTESSLRVAGVDVGARGFLRRLGIERLAVRLADVLGYSLPEAVIPWSYVASLEGESALRLGVDRELLAKLRPIEVAEILDALSSADRARLLGHMPDAVLAEALFEASAGVRADTLEEIGRERAARVLEIMPPDEAVDVLGALHPATAESLLVAVGVRERRLLRDLLGYHPRTAAGLMTPEFVSVPHRATVGEALEILRRESPGAESVYYVYAIDEAGSLRGVVPLRDVLTAPASSEVAGITRAEVVRVHVDESDEDAAETMERYDLLALPVVDDGDVLRGIITVDDIIRTVESRASEDLAAVSGAGDFGAGRLWGLVSSIAGGMLAAVLLLTTGSLPALWFLAGMIPLLLRLAQDQGSWALAVHLEERTGPSERRALLEVAASVLAAVPPALVLGAGATVGAGRRTGVALAASVILAAGAASALGLLIPLLAGRDSLLSRGRLVPLISSLGGLAVYIALLGGLGI